MTRLPVISGRELVRRLEKIGYHIVRQRGSHMRLLHNSDHSRKAVTVPDHREIKPGLLYHILKDTGLTVEEFNKLK